MESVPAYQIQLICCTLAAVLSPLIAFLINGLLLSKGSRVAGWLSNFTIAVSCVCSVFVFLKVWNVTQINVKILWFTIGTIKIYAGVLLNNLSVLLLALVSIVALPVHVYGTAYMKGDVHYGRYFAYLSLFCFSMLALVVSGNLIVFYTFWELVGFSSYLLIGFWNMRDKAVEANKKAFIMNRIGDIGLLTAIIILFTLFHTFDIEALFGNNGLVKQAFLDSGSWRSGSASLPAVWQYIACGGLILAVAAKSAQFPLHTWLPDAMEGPTSVSALIHAATMVAAGVFLLGRFYPLFTGTELTILAIIGCFTAFMAASIALTQNDLKRILAYSTISQLGFMVIAMGIGAYGSALFHLVTHAFFKCLLFLAAGSIIHQMQHFKDENQLDIDPQNILYMGGLRKKMPLTFTVFVIAALALIGLPFTSGYLSKDGILIQAFDWAGDKHWLLSLIPITALIAGAMTAFYVARLVFKIFFGKLEQRRIKPEIQMHFSDGETAYKLPLVFLAVCCLFPLFSLNPLLYENAWLLKGLGQLSYLDRVNFYHTLVPAGINILSIVIIYWAYMIYVAQKRAAFPQQNWWFRLSYNEWYIDSFYNDVIAAGVLRIGRGMFWADKNILDGILALLGKTTLVLSKIAAWVDKYLVDGFLHGNVSAVSGLSNTIRRFQNGRVQCYLFSMLAIMLAFFVFKFLI